MVWKRGLFLKLAKILNCKMTLRLIESMFKWKCKQIQIPPEWSLSWLSSNILFNVYTTNITSTISRKVIYTNDVGLVAQAETFKVKNIEPGHNKSTRFL